MWQLIKYFLLVLT